MGSWEVFSPNPRSPLFSAYITKELLFLIPLLPSFLFPAPQKTQTKGAVSYLLLAGFKYGQLGK